MKPHYYLSLLFFLCIWAMSGLSQEITFSGSIIDRESGTAVPYATVAAISSSSSNMISGTTSDFEGNFNLVSDSVDVFIQISFLGYETLEIRDFPKSSSSVDLGQISIAPNTQQLEAAEVEVERSVVEFKLDKRVFNVGKDISSTGMSAMEVLGNVPSVNVNIEGQVSLRGSTGVQILINGKPSVLTDEGSNALGSITADMIESVEVITNPSAKYQAEGTSGIINIILKKEEKTGFNGSISVNSGIPDNHSIGVSLNRRTENFNFFTQFGVGYRSMPRFNESINGNPVDDTEIRSKGTEYRNENFYNITLGTDYYLNDRNIITLAGSFAYEIEEQPSETEFSFYDAGVLQESWRRNESTEATNPKYQYDLQYKREFKDDEDHILLFSTLGRFFGKDLSSSFTNTSIFGNEEYSNQLTETNFYQADYTFKLDYTDPINDVYTLETGALYEINDVGNEYAVFNEEAGEFVADSGLTNTFEYYQQVLGVYATGAYEKDKWGVKVGLRAEHTDLQTLLKTTGEENDQLYTNLFPSLHTSYKISPLFSLQAGYSKRIFRPRLWDLNPFFNIRNNFNIRRGNPELEPEFADSYELTGIFIFEKLSLNSSIYYLYTTNVNERISMVEDNVNVTMPVNLGSRAKTGFEFNGKYTPYKWLVVNGDVNVGVFQRRGVFQDQNFDFNANQWSSRMTAKFKLPRNIDLEVSGDYQSDVQTVQGEQSGFASMDAGIRKKLWDGKAIVNVSVRDIFASRIRETTIDRSDFYLYNFSQRGRFITFGASFSFGKGEAMTYSGRRH